MTQFVLYYDILILRNQLHICVNVSHIYKLSGLNLPTQWPYLRYSVFTVISSKKEWNSKQKHNNLTCTENLMINCELPSCCPLRLSRLSVNANIISVKYSPFHLFYILIYTCVQCLNFLGFICVWRSRRKKRHVSRTSTKRRRWKYFILRVQGLTLTSDGAYDKHDT